MKVVTKVEAVNDGGKAMESHVTELRKEVEFRRNDDDQFVWKRRDEMLSESAVTRVSYTLRKYP